MARNNQEPLNIVIEDLEYILRLVIKVTEYIGSYIQEWYPKVEVEKLFGIQFGDEVYHYVEELGQAFITIDELFSCLSDKYD